MSCGPLNPSDAHRFVGDPIDVVSGAQIEVAEEFRLPGIVPLVWIRHYDSSKVGTRFGLGWGHAHDYERSLSFDADGIRYVGPLGASVGFPYLDSDGAQSAAQGYVLRRISASEYQLDRSAEPTMEFRFGDAQQTAPLAALIRGAAKLEFRYRADGALAGIGERGGRAVRVDCDDTGRVRRLVLVSSANVDERILLAYEFDSQGNLVGGADAYQHRFSFEYDRHNRIVRRTDRRGYSFKFAFDDEGRCVHSGGEDGVQQVHLQYQPEQRRTLVTRADGGVWQYRYDERKLLVGIVDPYGGLQEFRYDDRGRVLEEVDAGGEATHWLYDGDGLFVGKRSSLGHVAFDGASPLRPDQQEHRVPITPAQWEYGDLLTPIRRRPVASPAPALQASLLVTLVRGSPATGSRETISPARGNGHAPPTGGVRQIRDVLGTLLRETDTEGRTRSWSYDAGGNTTRARDFDGGVVACEYGSWDLPIRRSDALGRSVTRRYTTLEQIAEEIDAAGVATSYAYDLKGRLSARWYDGVLLSQFRYDVSGNLIEVLDGKGSPLVAQKFGPHNLKVARQLGTGDLHEFAYTERGLYKRAATSEVAVEFAYDEFLHRTRDERDGRGVQHQFAAPGKLARTTVLGRFTTTYRWMEHEELEVRDPSGGVHRVRFLDDGTVLRSMANGTVEAVRYDEMGRCRARASAGSRRGQPWVRHYEYSGEGDLLELRDSTTGITRFAYDAAHRLREVVNGSGERVSFAHDAADNLLEQPGLQLVEIGPAHRIRTANGEEFEHDDRGNVAQRRAAGNVRRYRYDSRNMLVSCESGRGEWRATYDALGRRVRTSLGSEWTEFYWDTDRLAAELRHDGRLRIYVYADAFALVPLLWLDYDEETADLSSGRRFYPLYDHLGTPVRVEDDSGASAWSANVGPYGAVSPSANPRVDVSLRFPGHFFDAALGLHYNRFRYYDPTLGRYIQPDPLGTIDGANPYAYSANPLREVDVRGDCPNDGTKQQNGTGTAEDGDPAQGLKPGQFRDEDGRLRNADGTFAPEPRGPYSHLEDHPSVGPGKDFTEAQKARIIAENMARNGGVVRSDDPNDPHQILVAPAKSQSGVTPPQNEWQIDHIVAKDNGGTNSYTNARVVSRQLNRQKSNN